MAKDYTYIAKIGKGWLKGHDIVYDKDDADIFESETEPKQRINQMKKDGKIGKDTYAVVLKQEENTVSALFESIISMGNS